MAAKAVQISMDTALLDLIDADPEARTKGRSAFVRTAIKLYLEAKQRRSIETRLAKAYSAEADAMLEEIEPLMDLQSWPED